MKLNIKNILLLITFILCNNYTLQIKVPSAEEVKQELQATINHIKTMPPEEQEVITQQMKAMAQQMGDETLVSKLNNVDDFIQYVEEEIDTWAAEISSMIEKEVAEYNNAIEKQEAEKNTQETAKENTPIATSNKEKIETKEKNEVSSLIQGAIESIQKLKIQIVEHTKIQDLFLTIWEDGYGTLELVEHYLTVIKSIASEEQKTKKILEKKDKIKNIALKITEIDKSVFELTTYTSVTKNENPQLLTKYNKKDFSEVKEHLKKTIIQLEQEEKEIKEENTNKKKLIRHKIDFLEEELVQANLEEKNETQIKNQQNKKYEKEITDKINYITLYLKKIFEEEKLTQDLEAIIKDLLPEQIEIGKKKQQIINEQKKKEQELKKKSLESGSKVFTDYTQPENIQRKNQEYRDSEEEDNTFNYESREEHGYEQSNNDEQPFGFQKEKIELPEQKPIEKKEISQGDTTKKQEISEPQKKHYTCSEKKKKHHNKKDKKKRALETKKIKEETEQEDNKKNEKEPNQFSKIQKTLEDMHEEIISFSKNIKEDKNYFRTKNIETICQEYFKTIEELIELIKQNNGTENEEIALKKINFTINLIKDSLSKIDNEKSTFKAKVKRINKQLQGITEKLASKDTKKEGGENENLPQPAKKENNQSK
jgi:hypothetical protein